jgi:outer membrane protein OmpA-like peptidoglycan-associated protein
LKSNKSDTSLISQTARAAIQTAEDARLIAERRAKEQDLANAHSTVAAAEAEKLQAQADAQRSKAEADAAKAQTDAERAARRDAEAAAAAAEARAAALQSSSHTSANRMVPPPAAATGAPVPSTADAEASSLLRMRLLESLNGVLPTRDTPRGLVLTVPDQAFNASALRTDYSDRLARAVALLSTEPGLRFEVEGSSDSDSSEGIAMKRAYEVRDVLTRAGLPAAGIQTRGLGASRLLNSNATESGRLSNRRVEIIISGNPIGDMPFWDHTYKLTSR